MLALSIIGIMSAILVVTSTSTVFSVLWLISTFMVTSLLLGLLNLGFPSLLYVIVYIGAIAILFLFVVQLLDLNNSEETGNIAKSSSKSVTFTPLVILWVMALVAIIVIIGMVLGQDPETSSLTFFWKDIEDTFQKPTSSNISSSYVDSYLQISPTEYLQNGIYSSNVYGTGDLFNLAEWLYGPGILPLLIISIILLISMVAPISLCISKSESVQQ